VTILWCPSSLLLGFPTTSSTFLVPSQNAPPAVLLSSPTRAPNTTSSSLSRSWLLRTNTWRWSLPTTTISPSCRGPGGLSSLTQDLKYPLVVRYVEAPPIVVEIRTRTCRETNHRYSTNGKTKEENKDLTRFKNLPTFSGQKVQKYQTVYNEIQLIIKDLCLWVEKENQIPSIWVKNKIRI